MVSERKMFGDLITLVLNKILQTLPGLLFLSYIGDDTGSKGAEMILVVLRMFLRGLVILIQRS